MPPSPARSLNRLNERIVACRACPRLVEHREAVARDKRRQFASWTYWGRPVPGFGDPNARLLIVGLAPAAHGANRTGRMFTGDASGDWLYEALYRFGFANQAESRSRDDGLTLNDCYITAAARCAPPGNKPTSAEFENCQPHLQADIRLLPNLSTTLVLGQLAHQRWLKATGWWNALEPNQRPRFAHAYLTTLPDGMRLLSSYHPSRQNTRTGRLSRDMWHRVFRKIRRVIDQV
jgi:uracil-DNA glycosylase family 4